MRLLLIEDEKQMAEAIAFVLSKNHYTVDIAYDGEAGLDYALDNTHDLIILDIMLPKRDGLSVLKEIRKNKIRTPVILLTAKGETEDKIIGLDAGADDYLAKPFNMNELLARLRVLLRRKGEITPTTSLSYGDIEVNPHTLFLYCNKQSIKLTLKECQLLESLIQSKNMVLSKERIIEKVWGFESDANDHHVEVYISFLRKKLIRLESNVFIETMRGLGYRLAEREEMRTPC